MILNKTIRLIVKFIPEAIIYILNLPQHVCGH